MTNDIRATLIWYFEPSVYMGNAFFFSQVCEELDKHVIEVTRIERAKHSNRVKVVCEISVQMDVADEDEAVFKINALLIETALPEPQILIHLTESEFLERKREPDLF